MVYAGTVVIYGGGRAVVAATGMDIEMGRIATLMMDDIGRLLAYLCIGVAALVSAIGLLTWHYDILTMIIWVISLAIAAVPEALPAIVTGALAIGMYKMVKRNAIIAQTRQEQ